MSDEWISLDSQRAMAFHEAFDKRANYMEAEGINWLAYGEETVPLPGCPACSLPAEAVMWAVYDESIKVVVSPCGHRLQVQRPVVVTTKTEESSYTEEWMP